MNAYKIQIKERYSAKILESIEHISCEGYFDFKEENGYAFLNVSRDLATSPLKLLKDDSFGLRYMIRKNKYPGKI